MSESWTLLYRETLAGWLAACRRRSMQRAVCIPVLLLVGRLSVLHYLLLHLQLVSPPFPAVSCTGESISYEPVISLLIVCLSSTWSLTSLLVLTSLSILLSIHSTCRHNLHYYSPGQIALLSCTHHAKTHRSADAGPSYTHEHPPSTSSQFPLIIHKATQR